MDATPSERMEITALSKEDLHSNSKSTPPTVAFIKIKSMNEVSKSGDREVIATLISIENILEPP